MPRARPFMQVDVFTETTGLGNGLAVVLDGSDLSAEEMQRFARWTQLAETTFLLPASAEGADYHLRIFTQTAELPFAGHPTLGSAAAFLASGRAPLEPGKLVQQCTLGLVEIDLSGPMPAFTAPQPELAPMDGALREALMQALQLNEAQVRAAMAMRCGPDFLFLELQNAEAVRTADPAPLVAAGLDHVALFGLEPEGAETQGEARLFSCVGGGLQEDAATGSLSAGIARWLADAGRLTGPMTIAQGSQIGRAARLHYLPQKGKVLIGGHSVLVIDGKVTL